MKVYVFEQIYLLQYLHHTLYESLSHNSHILFNIEEKSLAKVQFYRN